MGKGRGLACIWEDGGDDTGPNGRVVDIPVEEPTIESADACPLHAGWNSIVHFEAGVRLDERQWHVSLGCDTRRDEARGPRQTDW